MKPIAMVIAASAAFLLPAHARDADQHPQWDVPLNYSFNRGGLDPVDTTSTTATAAGNAVVTAGNRYLTLDGSGDWITTSDAAGLDVSSAFSLSFWVQPNSPGTATARVPICRYLAGSNKRSWLVSFRYADTPQRVLLVVGNGTALTATYQFNETLPTSGWNHYVAVYDDAAGALNRWKLYHNGAAVAYTSNSVDTGGAPFATDIGVRIGNDNDGTAATAWKGDVDDVKIINRAITSAEVAQLYSAGHP